jgi:hypothetical protein
MQPLLIKLGRRMNPQSSAPQGGSDGRTIRSLHRVSPGACPGTSPARSPTSRRMPPEYASGASGRCPRLEKYSGPANRTVPPPSHLAYGSLRPVSRVTPANELHTLLPWNWRGADRSVSVCSYLDLERTGCSRIHLYLSFGIRPRRQRVKLPKLPAKVVLACPHRWF